MKKERWFLSTTALKNGSDSFPIEGGRYIRYMPSWEFIMTKTRD